MKDNTKSLENLKKLFDLTNLECGETIPKRFEKIAKSLFENYAIKADNELYRFVDIEFYYSAPGHPDYITHPRKGEALHWYINDFGGIDINFESNARKCCKDSKGKPCDKYYWDETTHFGGILIRQLEMITEGENELLYGPMKVAELFRDFSALDGLSKCPQLIHFQTNKICPKPCKRHNLVKKEGDDFAYGKKINTMKSWYVSEQNGREIPMDVNSFKEQVNYEYRYCDPDYIRI